MNNWSPTSPLITGLQALRAREGVPSFDDWSIAELLRGERLAPSTPVSLPVPVPSSGEPAESSPLPLLPEWLADSQWRPTAAALPWPASPLPSTVSEDPFERAAIRTRRSVISDAPRRPPMGPPFLDEAPQDYPSYLGPVPQAPSWEQTVTGATPWSPVASLPRATDWGKVLTGIECRRGEGSDYAHCITPGGRQLTVPAEGLPNYIGPDQPNYHYYNLPVDGPSVNTSELMQGVIDSSTPGPRPLVRPATPEGTLNEATPNLWYSAFLVGTRLPYGTPQNPLRSYLIRDQTGALMVVNVTMPGHGLQPGVVVRYVTESPRGTTIQNEGSGLGMRQAPGGFLSDWINNVWNGQSRAIIEDQIRRQRR